MRLRIVTPITAPDFGTEAIEEIRLAARPDACIEHVRIDAGPASIEGAYDEALAVPDTVRKIVEAERDGVQGVLINCMGDPGLYPARERVGIPVLGPFQTAAHVAAMIGHRFSVVTVLDSVVPTFWQNAAVYGVAGRMASVRSVDIPVLDLEADTERMVRRLVAESALAVREDGADTVIFGCTGMTGVADRVRAGLLAAGFDVPVIDPMPVSLKILEAVVEGRLSQSRRAFMTPRPKACPGYADLAGVAE